MGFFFFLLLVGPLIFVHELGHFLAARRYGVLCEEFAIGFGPKVASWKPGETEYSLRALPLGGYVRMLGMFEETVEEEHKGRYLQEKSVWQRFVIYLAGPVMNLLIPIPIIFAVLLATEARMPPLVGALQADSPAMVAGLQPGDEIIAVDGRPIRFFDELSSIVSRHPEVPLTVEILRGDERLSLEVVPERVRVRDDYVGLRWKERGRLGVMVGQYGPVLDVADPYSSAAIAGLRTFDRVVTIDGERVRTWDELHRKVADSEAGRTMSLVVLRPEIVHETPIRLDRLTPVEIQWRIPSSNAADEIAPARGLVLDVTPGSPAAEAGFRIGDRIMEIDGRRYGDVTHVLEVVVNAPDEAHDVRIQRGDETLVLTLQARTLEVTGDFGYEHERTFVGLRGENSFVAPQARPMRAAERFLHALKRAFLDTIGFIGAMILGVAYLVVGTVDSSSLGGPILIADLASRAGAEGMAPFLRMMALISINLGILNLLPIPGLDGGHLSILAVEAIKRGPLSPRTRQIINFVGFVMIVLLMIFVFKNDIERYWEDIRNWLNA